MKVWIGVTDSDWFECLSARQPDEVNFWQPSGGREFKVLQPGEPFLFKLHSPRNFIVGGGFFVRYSALLIPEIEMEPVRLPARTQARAGTQDKLDERAVADR